MGPPSTMLAATSVLLLATVVRAQHEGFQIAPPAIHSGVASFRRDQYRYLRQAYADPSQQQYAQPQQQNSYQVSGAVAPQQNVQFGGSYSQVMMQPVQQTEAQLELQQMQQRQVFAAQGPQGGYAQQPPPAPLSPFLPQQQQHLGSYAMAGQQLQQPQQFNGGGFYQQQPMQQQQQGYAQQQPFPQQQQYAAPQPVQQQPPQFYQQGPPVSPAAQNPFFGQQQQLQQSQPGAYAQQQQPQFQPLPVAQQPQFQPQQQQYQAPPPQPLPQPPLQQQQQQAYAQQPFNQPQYSAPQQPQQLQRPAAVIAPPPIVQQLPQAVARPAPPPQQQLQQDVRDPAAAVAATARPPLAPAPFETVTVVTVDSRAEQVADLSHSRGEARQPKLRHKKKKRVKVLPTTVETVTVSAVQQPVSAHRASHRIVTTTFPPSIAPPRVQQQRVRPSTPPPALPPQQIVNRPQAHVHVPSNRPSKLVELTTAASIAAGVSREPNDVFLQCCRETGIDQKCHSRCNFDTLTKKVLTGMFLGTDPCPQKNGRNMLECAAQKGDHTPCCLERGVHTTAAKNKCLGFCVMTPGSSFMADISMLPCWAVLNDIKGCFKDAILDQ